MTIGGHDRPTLEQVPRRTIPCGDLPTLPVAEPQVEEPQCPEGQVFEEETGLCVLEEPEAAEQSEQSTEDADGSEDNSGSN